MFLINFRYPCTYSMVDDCTRVTTRGVYPLFLTDTGTSSRLATNFSGTRNFRCLDLSLESRWWIRRKVGTRFVNYRFRVKKEIEILPKEIEILLVLLYINVSIKPSSVHFLFFFVVMCIRKLVWFGWLGYTYESWTMNEESLIIF